MDIEQFDALTRRLSSGASSRRQTLRILGGVLVATALGAMASRLGAVEETEANAKPHNQKAKHTHQQPAHASPERQAQQHPKSSSAVQSATKGRGKGKGH